jgi:hypothetical protein
VRQPWLNKRSQVLWCRRFRLKELAFDVLIRKIGLTVKVSTKMACGIVGQRYASTAARRGPQTQQTQSIGSDVRVSGRFRPVDAVRCSDRASRLAGRGSQTSSLIPNRRPFLKRLRKPPCDAQCRHFHLSWRGGRLSVPHRRSLAPHRHPPRRRPRALPRLPSFIGAHLWPDMLQLLLSKSSQSQQRLRRKSRRLLQLRRSVPW